MNNAIQFVLVVVNHKAFKQEDVIVKVKFCSIVDYNSMLEVLEIYKDAILNNYLVAFSNIPNVQTIHNNSITIGTSSSTLPFPSILYK